MELQRWGWDDTFAASFREVAQPGHVAARVAVEHRSRYVVRTGSGECEAVLAGRLRHATADAAGLPAVGDWVAVARDDGDGPAVIHAVLPRRTCFSRAAAGAGGEQVVAANVDIVLIVTALDGDLNERRLERYLTLAWESGASPVIVLTKSDLATDPDTGLAAGGLAAGVPVVRVSALTGDGLDRVRDHLAPGRTVALLGSSGVGKSTLINAILGESRLRTGDVRADGRGRHTTTHRQLVLTGEGALLLDTPGMREIQLWAGERDVEDAFDDILVLAEHCRFTDCAHDSEPGCAVAAAVADGSMSAERLSSYRKLLAEVRHLEARYDPDARGERKRRDRMGSKAVRAHLRRKYDP